MSADLMVAIRTGGSWRFAYDRWAASNLAGLLLRGPEDALAYLEALAPTDSPFLERWLCGAVCIDRERHELVYWYGQLADKQALGHRTYHAALAEVWRGWRCRFAMRASRDITDLLGVPAVCARERTEARTALELRQELDVSFLELRADPQVAAEDDDLVRSWAEGDFPGWLAVRWADGRVTDYRIPYTWAHFLDDGVPWLDALRDRPPVPLDHVTESEVTQAALIDERTRRVAWWWIASDWVGEVAEERWPGFTLEQVPAARALLADRPGAVLRTSHEPIEDLTKLFDRILGRPTDPAALLTSVARRYEQPGVTVHVETGFTAAPPEAAVVDDDWRARILRLARPPG